MQIAKTRLLLTGEITAWGKQFLTQLESLNLAEIAYEPVLEKVGRLRAVGGQPPVVILENQPDSRKAIEALRAAGRPLYVLWFGRNFSKEDLAFAVEHRVFAIFENQKPEDQVVAKKLAALAGTLDQNHQFENLLRAIKGILLQSEEDGEEKPLVQELKSAVGKLEKVGGQTAFLGSSSADATSVDEQLPFHKTQSFGDALETVHDLERTGLLRVRGKLQGQEGSIEFLKGKITGVVAAEVTGVKALYRMFLWDEPKFLFARRETDDAVVTEAIPAGVKEICAHGNSMRLRYESIRKELPPNQIRLQLAVKSIHPATAMSPVQFSTLSSVVEFGKIADILDYNPLPDVDIYECLIQLRKMSLLMVAG